ncbi:hypothetical protein [Mycolicibacter sinensis]|uniref:Uncharacterized protein n=1 Tax=Mycolicibacter sinensis (strain JDM601) TaxID=875328 RepID=A0A1A3U9H9_MYCSD|nr:hypothetical protein [Mycolicibacter sinensis]OBK91494.1 hypothetical protein A5648_14120 [Mycolicibacter sinensis]
MTTIHEATHPAAAALAAVPRPAGAISVGDWQRSPNDAAFYREHLIQLDEPGDLRVWTQGFEVVADTSPRVIVRVIKITQKGRRAGVIANLSARDAEALGRALIASAALVAELDAADEGDTLGAEAVAK